MSQRYRRGLTRTSRLRNADRPMPEVDPSLHASLPTTPERARPVDPRAADGAPNVIVIILDDVGFGQLGCFGSDMATPNIDALAAGGLRYSRFHVTAMCSPTRASVLTGRNHHAVGMGFLADMPMAYPGYTCRLPKSVTPLPRVLRDAGYNTTAIGKWHLVPRGERSHSGPFDRWPLGYGFERFYGFLQGDTNQWTPNLVRDNHYVDPPRGPEAGYHLSEDLADAAIQHVLDQQQAAPDKPFYLSFALGAMHAPHHVTREWVERYEGRFDAGWEAWREATFARQLASGIVPEGTVLTERPSWIQAWNDLPADERRMHARMQEVFAGFLTHTDAQIGRLVDRLRAIGVLDNTIVMLISDNGASGEGGTLGTVNEHRFTSQRAETVAGNLEVLDDWGGFRAYNHYSWGWAWAGNTPLRLWKRYTWLGGTRAPLIVHWPAGIDGSVRGEIRSQFCHAVDLMPTLLDACRVTAPDVVDGVTQTPFDGASLLPTFAAADAPAPRTTQYFELLGSRSIVHDGWKATTDHVSQGVADEERLLVGSRDLATDRWSLFRLDDDFSEAHDVAAEHPDVVRALDARWNEEAERNHVFPLVDSLVTRVTAFIPPPHPPGARCVFRPDASPATDESLPYLVGGFRITAVVEPSERPEGVLAALGDWNAGFAFFVRDGYLSFVVNAAGDLSRVVADVPVPASPAAPMTLGCTFVPGGAGGSFTLTHDEEVVGRFDSVHPVPLTWQHGGAAFMLGRDKGFPVCDDYTVPFPWTGVLHEVVVEVPGPTRPDPDTELREALRRD
jgi:arylsulfatase A-like enzyme